MEGYQSKENLKIPIKAVSEYNRKLQLSKIPKLLLYAEPGGITKPLVE